MSSSAPAFLALRGGSFVLSSLSSSEHRDAYALATALLVMLAFEATVKGLVKSRALSSVAGRKALHIGCGPIFLLLWPLFSDAPHARRLAALCPGIMTAKFAAVGAEGTRRGAWTGPASVPSFTHPPGLGLLHLPNVVASMSRSGDRRELLRGPTMYGIVFTLATLASWRDITGVMALTTLCVGDASAEVSWGSFRGTRRRS